MDEKDSAALGPAEGVYVMSGVFSPEECADLIRLCEDAGFEPATLSLFGGAVRRPDVRNNDRVIWDDPSLAASVWARVAPHVPEQLDGRVAVGLNERFRFYRYDPGQRFSPHMDGSYVSPTGAVSQLTLLVYLNGGFEGGETVILGTPVPPETGKILAFRHRLLHEGAEVRTGRKYVLRSDVMYL